jgi:adenylate cyclase
VTDAAELERLERARLASLVARDLDAAGRLHAEDYELITPGGATLSRADYLDAIASGAMRYHVFEADSPVRVRSYQSGGIVRYIARIEMEVDGERYSGRYWHTDTWESRDGQWQAAWSQATRLPQVDGDGTGSVITDGLTDADLARRAGTTPERIRDLVKIRVLRPKDGSFGPGDVQRVQIVAAFEDRGIELDHIAQAIDQGRMSFEFTDRIYPEASSPTGRTFGDLMTELGERGALLPDVLLALGRPRPDSDTPLTESDEHVLRQFFDAWVTEPFVPEVALRAARLLGDASRRAAEGWVALFNDAIQIPNDERDAMRMEELRPRILEPAVRVAGVFEPMALWLLRHHMEQALNAANIESLERALESEGLRPRVDRETPAMVFADISGFTRLTEEHGDALAVGQAESLSRLALVVAAELGGRLVKQLGDGVMLAFGRSAAAVEASLRLMAAARSAGLPELHVGISAGPLIERDGDYFGRTVNLASRLSGIAGAGEIVLNEAGAHAAGLPVAALGPTQLKGLSEPVPLFRLVAD